MSRITKQKFMHMRIANVYGILGIRAVLSAFVSVAARHLVSRNVKASAAEDGLSPPV